MHLCIKYHKLTISKFYFQVFSYPSILNSHCSPNLSYILPKFNFLPRYLLPLFFFSFCYFVLLLFLLLVFHLLLLLLSVLFLRLFLLLLRPLYRPSSTLLLCSFYLLLFVFLRLICFFYCSPFAPFLVLLLLLLHYALCFFSPVASSLLLFCSFGRSVNLREPFCSFLF